MTSGIERLARAIYARHHRGNPALLFGQVAPLIRDELLADVRALLLALKAEAETNAAMFEAGNEAQHPDDCTDVRQIFTAMLDHLLEGRG